MVSFFDFLNEFLNVYSLLACIVALLWWRSHSSHSYWRKLNVKSLKPIAFFGNTAAHALRQATLHDTIDRLYKELLNEPFGGFYQRHDPIFLVKDPKLISAILIKNFKNFHDRNDRITSLSINKNRKLNPINMHFINTTGERWRILRKKMTPVFSSGQLKLMHDQILHCSNLLTDRIEKEIGDGGSVDIVAKQFVGKFAIDVIGTCFFGVECNSLTSNDTFIEMCKESLKPRFPAIVRLILSMIGQRLLNLLNLRNMKKEVSDYFLNMIFDTMNHRRQSGFVRNDALQLMLQLQNSHEDPKFAVQVNNSKILPNEKFDEIDIAANSYMFFMAGYDTTTSTLTFCLYELAINENIQRKVRSEIQKIHDKYKILTHDSLKEMIYLDAVIAETLRKYPFLVFLNRKCTEDYVIPETEIRLVAGTKIIIPVWSIHHDSRYYPNPDLFDPERFIEDNKQTMQSGLYFPFGDGPRACLGKRFAETEMKLALSAIILNYNIKPCAKTEIPLTFDKSAKMFRPKNEIQINLSRRKCEGK